jgi:alginate biosynthesis protein Alg44
MQIYKLRSARFFLSKGCSYSTKETFSMKPATKSQISHESETQRQHPRFLLPSQVLLNGKQYAVKNLSAGGIAISDVGANVARGSQVTLELRFQFSAFSFGVPLTAEVQYYNSVEKILGCRFVNLGPEQVSFLSHVIRSFIAGDIVTSENLLNVAQRNNFTQVRNHANTNASSASFRRQLPGLLLVLTVGVLVAALILGNLYNSLFTVGAEDGMVAGPAVAVRASTGGTFNTRLDPGLSIVRQNQVIGTISSPGGAVTSVQSPCDCYVAKTNAASGDLALQGQPLVSLVPVDAKPWSVASMNPQQAKKIGPDSLATISIFGARNTYTGRVISMESPLADARTGNDKSVLMKVVPDQKLPVNFVNRLATVTFSIR